MITTLTLDPITIPVPAARTAPAPWPRPVPTPAEAADLFAALGIRPDRLTYLGERSWPWPPSAEPYACLVGVILVDACGGYARARAAIDAQGPRGALELATGWNATFVDGVVCGFSTGGVAHVRTCSGPVRDADFFRGAALGAATHRVLRDRGMLL
jgi:hypothetical protein